MNSTSILTPKKWPTKTDRSVAMVPKTTILIAALYMLEPPVLDETASSIISDRMVIPYGKYSILNTGANSATNRGKSPPTVNAAPDSNAA